MDRCGVARCGTAAQGVESRRPGRRLHAQGADAVPEKLANERIHRAEALELYAIDRPLVSALVTRLERRVAFSVSITDRELYISIGKDTVTGAVVRLNRA